MKLRKRYIVSAILGVVAIGGLSFVLFAKKPIQYETVAVERKDVVQEVSVTGKVVAASLADLSFEVSGKVKQLFAEVGDTVSVGQDIIKLDDRNILANYQKAQSDVLSAQAKLKQTQAALESEEAKLDEMKKGTRQEELIISQTEVENAKQSLVDSQTKFDNVKETARVDLANVYSDVADILRDAYTQAKDAVNLQLDDLFSNDDQINPKLTFLTKNSQSKIDVESQRYTVGKLIPVLQQRTVINTTMQEELDTLLQKTEEDINKVKGLLLLCVEVLNGAQDLSASTISTYKTNVNSALSNINGILSQINQQQQAIAAQKALNQQTIFQAESQVNEDKNALDIAQREWELKKAGSTPQQIQSQTAIVKQSQANVLAQQAALASARADVAEQAAQLDKYTLKSPIEGIVTKQTSKVGEIVSANTIVVSVISLAKFEMEANVPEVDIANIRVGTQATVDLDAYGNEVVWEASVIRLDPAETIIDGVSTYKVTLQFTKDDERIRSGMTANIDMVTGKREQVLAVPSRALLRQNGRTSVQVWDQNQITEVVVQTGLRGSDGVTEIIDGLTAGELVVIGTK